MTPRFTVVRWGGQDEGRHHYEGWSLSLEWFGLILEINFGKALS